MTEQPDNHLKWGFSSMGAPKMDLEELVDLAVRLECPNIELRTLSDTIDLPTVFENNYASPEAVRAVADSKGVKIICLNSSFRLSDSGEKEREQLSAYARWADHLGCRYIRVFGGGKWGDTVDELSWQTIRSNVAWWNDAKAANGWLCDIALETHDAFSGSTQCLQLIGEIGSTLPIIWDTHHTWKLAGESPAETWAKIGSHVKHVHVKDSVSQASARHPYTYVHVGAGEFPVKEVVQLLVGNAYPGVVSIEWEKLWHPYLNPLEAALEKARAFGLW